EIDELLATGKLVGIGEGTPGDSSSRKTISMETRLDQMRPFFDLARKYKVVARVHTGVVIGYPLTHHYWPETLHPLWITDLAVEYPDVPILLDHGGMQGWWSDRMVEEAFLVAAANDNVYLETGYYWTDLYWKALRDAFLVAAANDNVYLETGYYWTDLYWKALRDPNIGPEKLVFGTDWGASI